VRLVREQGEAARPDPADPFRNQNGGSEQHGADETFFDGFVGAGVNLIALFQIQTPER
jgi:hypothetical protein